MGREPCRKALVVRETRGANGFVTGVENAILAGIRRAWGRRCRGLPFDKLTDDPLLARPSDAVGRSTDIDEPRETELGTTIEVADEAQRCEWSDEKRRIRNRVRETDVGERCYRRKAVAETIGPIYRGSPRAEFFILVACRCRRFHVGPEVDGVAINSDMEPKIGVAKSIHEAIRSRCRGRRRGSGRFLGEIDG